ncbi:MAG: RNA polymerase sporulation sigma factor SigG [Oscillospiraceae bacterium]|nr:RNA polymerase sporulation sigma factor SigG [Oscillospiraceae bacterium]
MQGKVEICGVNTAKLRTLKPGEPEALLRRCKQGDKEAREQFIEGNLRLVLSVIQRFMGRGENPDDLFQVGCVGLLKAINNFNPDLDVKFSTYGVPMIVGELRRYLRDSSPIRVSRSIRDLAYQVLQCKERLLLKLGREATLEEISKELQVPLAAVSEAMDAIASPVSLYDPVHNDSGDPLTVMDQIRDPKNNDERWIEELTLKDAMSTLGEREKSILAMRYYDDKTQVEVAQEIGISQAQVSRLEKAALKRLRKEILS